MRRVVCLLAAVLFIAGGFSGCSNKANPVIETARATASDVESEAPDTGAEPSIDEMFKKYLPDYDLQYGMSKDQVIALGSEILDGYYNTIEDGVYAVIEKTTLGVTGKTGEATLLVSDSLGLFGISYDLAGGLEKLKAEWG